MCVYTVLYMTSIYARLKSMQSVKWFPTFVLSWGESLHGTSKARGVFTFNYVHAQALSLITDLLLSITQVSWNSDKWLDVQKDDLLFECGKL